jgi:hypothetical protein
MAAGPIFAVEYGALVKSLRVISAHRAVLATVPHVTIDPIAKGVNPDHPGQKWREGSRYFRYYIDPWIDEADFRPSKHRFITHQQARAIDSAIDQFNDTITDAVRHARREGRDWRVLDLCGVLDGLSFAALSTIHWPPLATAGRVSLCPSPSPISTPASSVKIATRRTPRSGWKRRYSARLACIKHGNRCSHPRTQ